NLTMLENIQLRNLPRIQTRRARALESLGRRAEALPLYEQLASDERSPFRSAATFGAAEMQRALGRRDEALKKFTLLTQDKEWATRTQLRAAELYIETGDAAGARRLLEEMEPT